jgi:tetratricopeptide (TPR) repeat protein
MSAAHPFFGTGIGTFETAYPRHALVGYTALAHNSYLQLAAEAGIPAALILILLAAGAWVPACASAAKGIRSDDTADSNAGEFAWIPDRNLMLCGIVAGTTASLMRNAVDSDWYITGVGLSFWALLGAGVALTVNARGDIFTVGKRARVAASGVIGVMLLASLLMLGAASKLGSVEYALENGDDYTAVETIKQSITLNPLNPEPHRLLGKIYAVTESGGGGHESSAVREMKKAVQLEPYNAKSYYQLAKIYEGEARPRDAVRAYEMGLRLEPHSPQMLLALALAYESAGMNPEALGIWRRLAAQEETPYEKVKAIPELVAPEYIFAQAALGREAERLGDRESARFHYRKALSRIEQYEASMQGMGKAWGERSASAKDTYALVESLKQEISSRLQLTGSSGK